MDIKHILQEVWTVPFITRESAAREAIRRMAGIAQMTDVVAQLNALPVQSKIVVAVSGGGTPVLYLNGVAQQGLIGLAERGQKTKIEIRQSGYTYTPAERNITPSAATTKVSFKGVKDAVKPPVEPKPNKPPIVSVGADVTVSEGDIFTLTATASDPDNDPLTYLWQHPPGCECNELDKPTLHVHGLAAGTYEFSCTVSDGKTSATDKVTVTVKAKEQPQPDPAKYKLEIFVQGGDNPVLHVDTPALEMPVAEQPIVLYYTKGAHVHPRIVEEGWIFSPNPAHLHISGDIVVTFVGSKINTDPDPTAPDLKGHVVVGPGQTLTIEESADIESMLIQAGGKVVFAHDKHIQLRSKGNIVIDPGGKMIRDTATGTNTITFHGFDPSKTVGGGHDVLSTDVGLWILGYYSARGEQKTAWSYIADARRGDKSITLEAAPHNWKAGDEIIISITQDVKGLDRGKIAKLFERRTITKVEGGRAHFNEPLLHDHLIVRGKKNWHPIAMHMTRSIVTEGTPTTRAHMFIRTQERPVIEYGCNRYMGIYDVPDGKGGKKNSGRYALHFHHCMDGVRGLEVKGYVCDDVNSHSFVPHTSHGVTFTDCIAFNYTLEAYWWDETEVTHNVTYDRCIAALGSMHDFLLGIGDELVCRNCMVIGGGLYRDGTRYLGGAFHWEANNEGVWVFEDCLAISCHSGMRVWQNTQLNHLQDRFEAVNCLASVSHGAYFNSYTYKDCIFHNAPFSGKATSSHSSGVRLERCYFDGAGQADYCLYYSDSPIDVNQWNSFINCVFTGYKVAPVLFKTSKPSEPDGTASVARTTKKYEFINCDFGTSNPFVWEDDVENGTIVRVQLKDGTAYQIEKVGLMDSSHGQLVRKEIAPFAPDLWHDGYGWKGEYYNGTKDFDPTKKAFERVDNIVAFTEWAVRSNRPIAVHHKIGGLYCIRWTARLVAQESGEHLFKLNAGGGIRMWIDGKQLFDDWKERYNGDDRFMPKPVAFQMEKGKSYDVKIEFYNEGERSGITVFWKRPSAPDFEIIPQSQLFPK